MSMDLEEIRKQIDEGDIQTARQRLKALTSENHLNTNAWELLASICDDPHEKAEYYRHILQVDPGNRQIAVKLLEITSKTQEPLSRVSPDHEFDPILYCKQCGGPAEVRFVGDLQEKRGICSYCGTEVDIPDSFQRIQKLREHHRLPGGGERILEKTTVETRRDGIPDLAELGNYPPELIKIIEILKEKGTSALGEEHLKELQESGIKLSFDADKLDSEHRQLMQEQDKARFEGTTDSQGTKTLEKTTRTESRSIFKLPFFKRIKRKRRRKPLSLEEIVILSSDPLPPDERANCPNPVCGAVVSKTATECPWCGQSL